MLSKLTQSVLVTGPSGVGKSSFARSGLVHEGGGLVLAAPGTDELDSYYNVPNVTSAGFDDLPGEVTGLREFVSYAKERLKEVQADVKEGRSPRYPLVVFDTISGAGMLAMNAALSKFSIPHPPPAQSPDGSAFYTYIRRLQEDALRVVRAFKGYGVHVLVLSHVNEKEVGDTSVARETEGAKIKMLTPAVPGAFSAALPSMFSTVLAMGLRKNKEGKREHYVQWSPDPKKMTKSRLGSLGEAGKIVVPETGGWPLVKRLIEEAALKRVD